MDIWYDEYKRENNNQASKFLKHLLTMLTGSIVFSFCEERTLLYILMKVLQHNQFAHSYTTELRNFHDRTALRKFSVRLGLRNILGLLDLENFQYFLDLENF